MNNSSTISPVRQDRDNPSRLRPESVVLIVAVVCSAGLVWGIVDANWVLVATEIPAVLALIAVAALGRARSSGREHAIVASGIGVACAVELWIATVVFDARGMQLAVIVAVSTAVTAAAGAVYWLYRRSFSP